MAVKTIEKILQSRREAAKSLQAGLAAVEKGKEPDPQEAIQALERMKKQHTERIAVARKAKEAAARRFDEEIGRLEKRIAAVDKRLAEHKKTLQQPKRPPAVRLRPGLVRGLGERSIERLADRGVRTVRQLAKAKPETVAEILGKQVKQASVFLDRAKKLLDEKG